MKETLKIANATELGLPETLGFGKLDIHSVRTRKRVLHASYFANEDEVYQVKIGDKCSLKEFYQGRLVAWTDHQGIEDCFLHHMMAVQPYHHPRFKALLERITSAPNIFMVYETADRMACYPGGSAFLLHQPIVPENREVRDELQLYIRHKGALSPVRHLAPSRGHIFRCTAEGIVDIEELEIQNYGAQLIDLSAAIELLWGNGLVPAQKEYRMEVAEIPVSLKGDCILHATAPSSLYRTYAVIREEEGEPTDLEKTADVISALSMRYIKNREAEAS